MKGNSGLGQSAKTWEPAKTEPQDGRARPPDRHGTMPAREKPGTVNQTGGASYNGGLQPA